MMTRGIGIFVCFLTVLALVFGIFGIVSAQNEIKFNGHVIDVKSQEPAVPNDKKIKEDNRYKKWIVQFTGPIHEADKKQLMDLGCRVGDYLPEFAFIVTMNNKIKKQVESLPFINGIVRYKSEYKISRKLKISAEKGKTIKLHVRVDGSENLPVLLSAVHKKKGKLLHVGKDAAKVEMDQTDIAQLAQIEEVLWIEEAVDMKLLNDTAKWTVQTDVPNDTKIWDKGLHGEGQIVGIGDTGLDYDMCFFRDPASTPVGPAHRKVVGYDSTYGDDYDADWPGHGTHVAGIVGGDRTPVDGLSTSNGMAPKSRFFMQDLTPGSSLAVYLPEDLGDLFIKAYDAGARIHTNSWGGAFNEYTFDSFSADRFLWEHKDFLALFANGNDGPAESTVSFPATAKNVISVGASLNGSGAESMASFSSHGPAYDGRIKPTVSAPGDGPLEGDGIISADSDGVKNSNNCGTVPLRGTSMATPAVAGTAALVRQYFMDGYYPPGVPDPVKALTPSAALVKAVLVNSAQDMTDLYTGGHLPATGQGWGRVNLSNALSFPGDTKTLEIVDNSPGLQTGESWSKSYYISPDQPLKVTLVWTDYPGATGTAKALVNDLDLTVTAPDGTTYIGNVFSNGESVSGGSADRLNVEEQVLIKTPLRGFYTITVTGYNVPNGPQPSALATTSASIVTPKGFISLDRHLYNASRTVTITVSDRDLNLSRDLRDEVYITITSNAEPGGETVKLVETGTDSAVFTGSIPLRLGAAAPNNGYLEIAAGDTITATYSDADDGTGSAAVVTDSAIIDVTPPLISSVTGTPGDVYADISWSTDEPADSAINYGETTAGGASVSDPHFTTQHSLSFGNLREGRTYYFEVRSTDAAGNLGTNNNSGSFYTFTTVNRPPDIAIYSSTGSETYENTTHIYGTAIDSSGVATVTINGTPVSYRATDGYFELSVSLNVGSNLFTVAATDTLGNRRETTIAVTRLLPPDLVMTAISVSPESGRPGGFITVTDTVSNIGAGDAKGFYVAYFLSTDRNINIWDAYVGYRELSGLAAGQSSSADSGPSTLTIPGNLPPGTYYIGAIANAPDPELHTYETDETNNSLAGNQITIEGSDLVMTSVSGPASGMTGPPATIEIQNTVTNNSSVTTPGFHVGIYLSEDPVITTSDFRAGERSLYLTPGASSSASTRVTIPSWFRPGTYYIGVIADYKNEVGETNETNNALAGNQITITGSDLTVTAVSGPTVARTGELIQISNTAMANATSGAAPYSELSLYLSRDQVITPTDIVLQIPYIWGYYSPSRAVPPLAPGETSLETTEVMLFSDIPPGTYYIGAIVDPLNAVIETNETNNALAGNQITIIGPDLTMSTISGPPSARTGDTVTISNTLAASASGGAALGIGVGIYLSTDNVITPDDIQVAYRLVPRLNAGAYHAADTAVTIPSSIAPGTYYIGAIADPTNTVMESDETNNAIVGNQITITGPDLIMSSLSGGPANANPGDTFTVNNTVTAAPTGGVSGAFAVGIYLSTDNVITPSDTLIGQRTISTGLGAGSSSADATAVTIPSFIPPGTYYIGAIADKDNVVAETDETNNALAGAQITITGADLVMTAVSGPTQGAQGANVTINSTASNIGTVAARAFSVCLKISKDNVVTTGDQTLAVYQVAGLAPGQSSSAATAVTLPTNLATGTYYIGAIADCNGYVAESDETNNATVGNQFVLTGPDLTVTAVSGPPSGTAGTSITVANTVAATSAGTTGAYNFHVKIYLSTDALITTSDREIGSRYIEGLLPGQMSSGDTTAIIPSDLASGTYYIGAIVDPNNIVVEPDEANNALAGNPIVVTRPDLAMSSVSGPATGVIGGTITVSNTAVNLSDVSSPGFTVGLYLSRDNVFSWDDIYVGSRAVSGLAAGASSSANTAVTIPSYLGDDDEGYPVYLTPGTYYIVAVADNSNQIAETSETNNALSSNQIVITQP